MNKEPWKTMSESLAELERTDPAVAEAAARYDDTVRTILQGRVHPLPCAIGGCEWHTPASPLPNDEDACRHGRFGYCEACEAADLTEKER